jgi:hypothetical protein
MNETAKTAATIPYFRGTKINSCAEIIRRNGQTVALAFDGGKTKAPFMESSDKMIERRSVTHEAYRIRKNLHLGMRSKPLERYTPDAHRSRMRTEEYVMPYKNSSSIVFGDRSTQPKRHFMTTAQNFNRKPQAVYTTNVGILSEQTKWQHAHEWS